MLDGEAHFESYFFLWTWPIFITLWYTQLQYVSEFHILDINELQIGFFDPRLMWCDVYSMYRWSTNWIPRVFDIRSRRDPSRIRPPGSQQPYRFRSSDLLWLDNVERINGTGTSCIAAPGAEWWCVAVMTGRSPKSSIRSGSVDERARVRRAGIEGRACTKGPKVLHV